MPARQPDTPRVSARIPYDRVVVAAMGSPEGRIPVAGRVVVLPRRRGSALPRGKRSARSIAVGARSSDTTGHRRVRVGRVGLRNTGTDPHRGRGEGTGHHRTGCDLVQLHDELLVEQCGCQRGSRTALTCCSLTPPPPAPGAETSPPARRIAHAGKAETSCPTGQGALDTRRIGSAGRLCRGRRGLRGRLQRLRDDLGDVGHGPHVQCIEHFSGHVIEVRLVARRNENR